MGSLIREDGWDLMNFVEATHTTNRGENNGRPLANYWSN